MAIAIEDKPRLTTEDIILLALMFLSIALAFAMHFTKDFSIASGLLVGSSFCLIGTYDVQLQVLTLSEN